MEISVVIDSGSYPFPFRTRQSSHLSPMVPGFRARESRSPPDPWVPWAVKLEEPFFCFKVQILNWWWRLNRSRIRSTIYGSSWGVGLIGRGREMLWRFRGGRVAYGIGGFFLRLRLGCSLLDCASSRALVARRCLMRWSRSHEWTS